MRLRSSHLVLLAVVVPILMMALPWSGTSSEDESAPAVEESLDEQVGRLMDEAAQRIEGREYFGAIQRYRRILARDESYAGAHLGLARCAFDLEEFAEAKEHIARALNSISSDPELQRASDALNSEIDLALSFTLEVVLPDLRNALRAAGLLEVEVRREDGDHCIVRAMTQHGVVTTLDLADLSPYAVAGPLDDGKAGTRWAVTLECPYGERIRIVAGDDIREEARAQFEIGDRVQADAVAELFQRAVWALTDKRPVSIEEELRRVISMLDTRSVCVSGEFMMAGRSRQYSSYSVASYSLSPHGEHGLRIERTNDDVVSVDGSGGKWGVDWIVDLAAVESVRVVQVEKRVFGSWLVQGALGQMIFGDLHEIVAAVEIGPVGGFERTATGVVRELEVLLLPAGENAEAVAMALHNASFLARH